MLLRPSIVREVDIPATGENAPDAAALAAVVEHCAQAEAGITTPGIVQAFTGSEHEGAITAALFLQHFTGDYPWAHLDIAGTMLAGERPKKRVKRHPSLSFVEESSPQP